MSENDTVEQQICDGLLQRNQSLATAESCSGGLIAHRITNVPGVSQVYAGGFVTYSNEAKMRCLGVQERTLEDHGAVSEEVARQMAEGARKALSADYGIGVTGIAGPGGGTAEKPVGLVYMAASGPDETRVIRCDFDGDRESIKLQTADTAMNLLLEVWK